MYTPTRWEAFKNFIRMVLCRHKNVVIRTVRGGPNLDDTKVIGRYKYCSDCKNNISGWL